MRKCPEQDVLDGIWKLSLEAEKELYPESDVAEMQDEFEVYATSKFCVLDVQKTLQEATWQSFFKSLNVE